LARPLPQVDQNMTQSAANRTLPGISFSEFFSLIHVWKRYPTPHIPLGAPMGSLRRSSRSLVGYVCCSVFPWDILIHLTRCYSLFSSIVDSLSTIPHSVTKVIGSAIPSASLDSITISRADPQCDQPSRPVDSASLRVANRSHVTDGSANAVP
jgi:hypothetical protein